MITDWDNIDLDSHEIGLCLVESLTFEDLLLAINCNLPEITEKTVTAQFEEHLRKINLDARCIFESNLKNLVEFAKAERAG